MLFRFIVVLKKEMRYHLYFSTLLYNMPLEESKKTECFELNGKHQLLVYADNVNLLGENLQTVREIAEIFIKASKDIGLKVGPKFQND